MNSYENLAANIAAIEKMGEWIALSKMFGELSKHQGCVIASNCFITGVPLLEYQRRNMLVGNKPGIPYDAMIAAFQEKGGKLKVIEKSPTATRIELTYAGITTPFSLTWEELEKEPVVYGGKGIKESDIVAMLAAGKKPKLKDKYATPRSRAVMIFARCVSDAIRTVAAEVNFGTYTAEELDDMDDQPAAHAAPVATPPAQPAASTAPPSQPSPAPNAASGATASTTAAPSSAPAETPAPSATTAPAATETPATPPMAVDPRTEVRLDDPAQEWQKAEVVKLMQMLVQEGMTDIVQRVKNKLAIHHIDGILGLTVGEANALIDALKVKELENWASSAIFGHKAKNNIGFPAPS